MSFFLKINPNYAQISLIASKSQRNNFESRRGFIIQTLFEHKNYTSKFNIKVQENDDKETIFNLFLPTKQIESDIREITFVDSNYNKLCTRNKKLKEIIRISISKIQSVSHSKSITTFSPHLKNFSP